MPLRPLQLGDFLSLPMKAISANRAVILGGPLLCVVIVMLAATFAATMWAIDQQDVFLYANAKLVPWSGRTIAATIVTGVLYLVTDAAAKVVVVPGVSRAILGERIGLGKAWAIARPRFPQVLLFYFLSSLIGAGVYFSIVALIDAGAFALAVPLILVAIPGSLFAAVFLGIAISAIILERIGAAASFKRAFSLMRGSSWRLVGNLFIVGFVLNMVTGAIVGLVEVILIVATVASSSLGVIIAVIIVFMVIVTVVTAIVQYSFMGSLFTLMSVDLRIRSEGLDVDLARSAEAAARR